MWLTIEVDPSDPRLDTSGSYAKRHQEPIDIGNDRTELAWLYDIDVQCHTFDGCEVLEYDFDALYEHFERTIADD